MSQMCGGKHAKHDDTGFHRLMKTGRPQYKIPSGRTVAHDVHVVFKEWITKMLKVYFFPILLIFTFFEGV